MCDVVIFGGGIAGLWLLDDLVRHRTNAILLEANALGAGQTIAAQGIIHGGLKYTLSGLMTDSASQIRDMPDLWRACLSGERQPDLSGTRLRSPHCYLWRTDSLGSRLGMIGARFGLRVAPTRLDEHERPALLANCPGTVARLDEPVISTAGLLQNLASLHPDRILQVDREGVEFELASTGNVQAIHVQRPIGSAGPPLKLSPRHLVFTAGSGNAALRRSVGLPSDAMQRRPLHQVLIRGPLPLFNGHCVDGAKTRVTITADVDSQGRTVWQLGGQIAEDGVAQEGTTLIAHAQRELQAVIPGIDFTGTEWSTYRVDRAERRTPDSRRPDTAQILVEGNCFTAWPTKLALAPQLSAAVLAKMGIRDDPVESGIEHSDIERLSDSPRPGDWPRPAVAEAPWESCSNWQPWSADTKPLRRAA